MATMPTNTAWVAAFQTLSVNGVKTLRTPPLSLGTADLPALWPELPEVALGRLLVSCTNENKTRRMFLHLAVEPLGQNTQKGNYERVIAYMDALETALGALTVMNFIDYSVAMVADILVAKTVYWGLRVEVTGQNVR